MVKLEKIDGSKVVLEIEVPEEKVAEALEKAYRKVVKTVSCRGSVGERLVLSWKAALCRDSL